MLDVIEIVLPVFIVIGLGYAIRRVGLVNGSFFSQVNQLVYYVCLPLLLIYKIATADFASSFNFNLVLASSLAVACCFLIASLYGKWRGFAPAVQGSFCQGTFRGNLAYIGLAIVFNAYGDEGLTRAGILLGFLVPVLNFFAILALLSPRRGTRTDPVMITKQIISNPLILASLLGILWSYFRIPMPVMLDRSLNIATGMTLPLALLSIGGSFSLEKIRGDIWKASLATAMKLLVMPVLAAGLMLLLDVSGLDFAIGMLLAGAPTAVATYIMACQMDADGELAATIVMLATACSAVTYTIMLFYLHSYVI